MNAARPSQTMAQPGALPRASSGRARLRRGVAYALLAVPLLIGWEALLLGSHAGFGGPLRLGLLPALFVAACGLWILPALLLGAAEAGLAALGGLVFGRWWAKHRWWPDHRAGALAGYPARLLAAGAVLGGALALELLVVAWTPPRSFGVPLLAGLGLLLLFQLAFWLGRPPWPTTTRPRALRRTAELLVLAAWPAAVAVLAGQGELRQLVAYQTTLAGAGQRLVQWASDLDQDGYPALLGADCAALDGARHPAATDLPGNQLDEDCLGGDAKSREQPSAVVPPSGRLLGRNVVLVTLGNVGAAQVSALGYHRLVTPSIDLLATRATLFTRAYAQSTTCATSLASLLKSRLPRQLRLQDVRLLPDGQAVPDPASATTGSLPTGSRLLTVAGAPRSDPAPSLAQLLRQHDYLTMAVVTAAVQAPGTGLLEGFQELDLGPFTEQAARGTGFGGRAMEAAFELLAAARGRTFFLWIHLPDPEPPHQLHGATPFFGDRPEDRYDGEVAYADAQVGRLLGRLEQTGLLGTTIVVLAADHGAPPPTWRGQGLPETLVRVPLLFLVPGEEPRRIDTPVENIDVLPTLLDLLGIPAPSELAGQSLQRLLLGQQRSRERPEAVVEVRRPGWSQRAIVFDAWKLVRDEQLDRVTLFQLRQDPGERIDRATSEPKIVRQLTERLAEWDQRGPPPF